MQSNTMLCQSVCKIFVCSLLLINCFVSSLVIMTPSWCRAPGSCVPADCLIDFQVINDMYPKMTANVGFADCEKYFFDHTSWVSLPAPNGTFNICIKDTLKCLGLTYNYQEAALQISLVGKNLQSVMQRWKLDGEKLINFYWGPANLCAEDKGGVFGVFLKPCNPAEKGQKFIFA